MIRLCQVATALIAVVASNVPATKSADPTTLTGKVTKVRDGDTVEIGKIPIRLNGVSAPELKEPLGPKSRLFMVELVFGKLVRCVLNDNKSYDRFVGTCYLNDRDLGSAVIEAGLARDCPRFSGGKYRAVETKAARSQIKLPGYCE